ncbi:MAG TPA: hypothetical protein VJP78_13135, partial [Thermoleophilia bacterium]|nr:hypothetical protein [Thermoleophilia bacterium]
DIEPLWVPRHRLPAALDYSVHCDTAFKDAKAMNTGAANVIQLWGHDRESGRVYYRDGMWDRSWSSRDFYTQLVNLLKAMWLERNFPFVVTCDAELGGTKGAFEMALFDGCRRSNIPCPPVFPLLRSSHMKDARIRHSLLYWKEGRVRLVRGAGAVDQLTYEVTHVGYAARRDMADAAADVFHPEVYAVAPGVGAGKQPSAAARPFDAELWSHDRPLHDDEIDLLYKSVEDQDFVGFLQDRYTH